MEPEITAIPQENIDRRHCDLANDKVEAHKVTLIAMEIQLIRGRMIFMSFKNCPLNSK